MIFSPTATGGHPAQGHALPLPPLCTQVLEQARAAGMAFGSVTLVSSPLEPGCMGFYDRASGNLWCPYDASQGEQGQRMAAQTLLILLLLIAERGIVPQTSAQEWEQVLRATEHASLLAQQWGLAALFTEQEVRALLSQGTRLALWQHAAGELVGHRAPHVARQAARAAQERRSQFAALREEESFTQALLGTSANEPGIDLLVDMDRACLRAGREPARGLTWSQRPLAPWRFHLSRARPVSCGRR